MRVCGRHFSPELTARIKATLRAEPAMSRRALSLRFAEVGLTPPKDSNLPAVTVWAVCVRRIGYDPKVKKPIEWMLLTTVPPPDFEAASERLRWHSRRWGIEVYHRTVKSGCRIQDRRLDDTRSLEACLAVDLVVA